MIEEGFFLSFSSSHKDVLLEEEIIAGLSIKLCNFNLANYLEGAITTISRRHFKIFANGHHFFIEDLNSSNGTEVNGQALQPNQPRKLFDDDKIRLAKNDQFVIQFRARGETRPADLPPPLEQGVYFHKGEGIFYVDEKPIHSLAPIPFDLLMYLYRHQKQSCSYYDIIQAVWYGDASKESVRTTISHLRQALNKVSKGAGNDYIKNISGYGYKLITP